MLLKPHTKFVFTELPYFKMWWDRAQPDTKESLRKWVKEGRWEFLNGGWSTNDEACPSY